MGDFFLVVVHIRLIFMRAAFLVLLCLVALTLASSMNLHRDAHKGAVAPVLKAEGSCHCHCPVFTCALIFDPDDENDAYYFDDDDENEFRIGDSGSYFYYSNESNASGASMLQMTMGVAVIV